MMIFSDVMVEANVRRGDLLRAAQKQRLIREAQRTKSESIPSQLRRIILAILLIRPF